MKHRFILLLLIVFTILATFISCSAPTINNGESSDIETEKSHPSGYTPIATVEDLMNISPNGEYILTADINLQGIEWKPIGNSSVPFSGLFDGNGHKITNLFISEPRSYVGVFGYNSGIIQNLKVENVNIDVTFTKKMEIIYAGAIAGLNEGTITNCTTSGNISSSADLTGAGGVVGYNSGGTIKYCFSVGNVSAKSFGESIDQAIAGGLVGINTSAVSHSFSSCDVSASAKNNVAGGLIGDCNNGMVEKCYATGNTYATISSWAHHPSACAGGLIGNVYESTVSECYSSGNVESSVFSSNTSSVPSATAGGLVGYIAKSNLNNCYSLCNVNSSNTAHTVTREVFAGRLVGNGSFQNIDNCYCSDAQMLSKTDGAIPNNVATNDIGEMIAQATLQTSTFHTDILKWSTEHWSFSDSILPSLKTIGNSQ